MADLNLSNKCRSYRIFKLKFELEKYVCTLPPLDQKIFVDLEHQTIDCQLKGEDTMASIEKKEHVISVILIKFVMNSTLY